MFSNTPGAPGAAEESGGASIAKPVNPKGMLTTESPRSFGARQWPPLLFLLPLLSACGQGAAGANAERRGDEAFATGDYDQAMTEYQLLLRSSPTASSRAKAAHVSARLDRIADALTLYEELIAQDMSYVDQAVGDFVAMAMRAADRGDGITLVQAMEAATLLRPGVGAPELTRQLAEAYHRDGFYADALFLYLDALSQSETDKAALWRVAETYKAMGDCVHALRYLERYVDLGGPLPGEAKWSIGDCALQRSVELMEEGSLPEALSHVELMLSVEEPRSRLAEGRFQRAEVLAAIGRCSEAVEEFETAGAATGASAQLRRAALSRIDEIRFRGERSEGRC